MVLLQTTSHTHTHTEFYWKSNTECTIWMLDSNHRWNNKLQDCRKASPYNWESALHSLYSHTPIPTHTTHTLTTSEPLSVKVPNWSSGMRNMTRGVLSRRWELPDTNLRKSSICWLCLRESFFLSGRSGNLRAVGGIGGVICNYVGGSRGWSVAMWLLTVLDHS